MAKLLDGLTEQGASPTCSGKTCFKSVASVKGDALGAELMNVVLSAVGHQQEQSIGRTF